MPERLDILSFFAVKEGADRRGESATVSDRLVTEKVFHTLRLASTTTLKTTKVSIGGIGGFTGTRYVYVYANQWVRFQWTTRNGASSNLTTKTGYGIDVAPNVPASFAVTGASTSVYITNRKASSTAQIKFVMCALSAT